METEDNLKQSLIDYLKQQLSEFEVLSSIYSDPGDIILTDPRILEDIKDFVDNKTQFTPNYLDFTLNVSIGVLNLEISINLPSFYPEEQPDIYIRCNQLNRRQETALNTDIGDFIKNHLGEQCLYTVISWLQENIEKYNSNVEEVSPVIESTELIVNDKFARFWIYSHHIYNKKKRDEIVKTAREFHLTGFSLPGKPGIVCIEGPENDCKEWWKIIKSMNWQKIIIRKTELFDLSEKNNERKFNNFEEIHFPNSLSRQSRHPDMSCFSKYLEELGLLHAFNEVFGFCNT